MHIVLFSLGTLASFNILKTDSDRCADTTYSCPVCGSETHIKPHWMVDFPTRDSNILDLFFTNRPFLNNPSISDHHTFYVNNITATRHKPAKWKIVMWGKADILKIKEMCKDLSDTIINSFTTCSNMNEVWTFFKRGCHLIIDDNVPHHMSSQRFAQPLINRDFRRLTHLKHRWQWRARRSNEQKTGRNTKP